MSVEYVSDAVEILRRKPGANAGNPNVVKILESEITSKTPSSSILTKPLEGPLFTPSCTILRTIGAAAAPITGGEIECQTMKSIGLTIYPHDKLHVATTITFAEQASQ